MSLFTRCILTKGVLEDGVRISIMSRHTLNDGVTLDPRIKNFDFHFRIFGPSPKLIGAYYKKRVGWSKFTDLYLVELREEPKKSFVEFLAQMAIFQNITLLCIEETAEKCHRRLLAEECQKYQPKLAVEHR